MHSCCHTVLNEMCLHAKHMWPFLIYINEVDMHAKHIEHVLIYINKIGLDVKYIRPFIIYINKIHINSFSNENKSVHFSKRIQSFCHTKYHYFKVLEISFILKYDRHICTIYIHFLKPCQMRCVHMQNICDLFLFI
jgi:hypothetical protein